MFNMLLSDFSHINFDAVYRQFSVTNAILAAWPIFAFDIFAFEFVQILDVTLIILNDVKPEQWRQLMLTLEMVNLL